MRSPGITSEDLVTFTLVNPHSTSNWAAYRDFLNDMFFGDQYAVKTHLNPRWQGWRAAGIVLIAGGVALLGMALAHHKTRKPKFYITVPMLLALQIGLILYFYR